MIPRALVFLTSAALAGALPALGYAAERLAGNVLRVDTDNQSIVILDAGRSRTVSLDPATSIRCQGEARTLADLSKGDRVVVTLAEGSQQTAATVVVAGSGRVESYGGPGVPGFSTGLSARNPPR